MEGEFLWRRFRCLAFELRLELLHLFLNVPILCVKQASEKLRRDENSIGKHLQELSTHGFVDPERRGKFLFYSISSGDALVDAVKHELCRSEKGYSDMVRCVTAFTHERRIQIVRQLSKKSVEFSELGNQCHISDLAMRRHLKKLESRNVVYREKGLWRLEHSVDVFSRELVQVVLRDITPDQV